MSRQRDEKEGPGEIALIGLGRWGGGPVMKTLSQSFPDVTIHAFARSNYQSWNKRSDLSPKIQIHRTADYESRVLNRPEIGAVFIATPLSSHYAFAKAALLAGKDVLVEKPIAKTKEEAAELVEIADRQKRILAVGYELMYDEALALLQKIILCPPF